MAVWVGVDPGEKRIGLARGDALGFLSTPRGVVPKKEDLLRWIQEMDEEYEVSGVIIGCPRNMDGSFGPMALRSLKLVRWLRDQISAPVFLWDERLTTSQAQGYGGHAAIDEKAAAILLQSYLDAGTPPAEDPPGLLEAENEQDSA